VTLVTLLVIPGRWRYCRSSENCRIASIAEDERNRDQLYDLVTGSGPAWFNAIRTSLPFFPASSREVMGFSYHRLDCLVKDRFTSPIRARIGMAAGLILLALMASLVLSRARNGPARAVQSTF
jgi:hypothetical protein